MNEKTKTATILLFCLIMGFALRFYTFEQKSLWLDEIYTYQDSKDGFKAQLDYYREEPTYLHPPFFYMVTHLFYPFNAPERDLRIIPLIFGTLSIPTVFLLARLFSRRAALPCAFALTFMTYHIALSQEARSYSLLLFLGITSLYFFMKHLITGKKLFLVLMALFFALMFHTSYSSIPFIAFSQLLWFYRPEEQQKKPTVNSFLLLNALIVVLCSPWILFLLFHYTGQSLQDPFHTEDPGSFGYILYGVLHDWLPHWPLQGISVLLLTVFPFFLKDRRNTLLLLVLFILPIMGLYVYCKALHVTHFISSKYFVSFLPFLLISLFLSLDALEMRFKSTRKLLRFKVVFALVFLASNLAVLPFYYRSEKQDNRGLVNYLKADLRDGDWIFFSKLSFFPGVLHYFGAAPMSRHYQVNYSGNREDPDDYSKTLTYQNKTVTMYHSETCCAQYVAGGNRLWIVVGKPSAETLKERSPAVFKGYFDGSFLNFNRFPTDASFYLFLWDPSSPNEEGIDLPIPK